jgi:hypothetical protein
VARVPATVPSTTPASASSSVPVVAGYTATFIMNAARESWDLDQHPFHDYGINTLSVQGEADAIGVVTSNGAAAAYWTGRGDPTRAQCQSTVGPADSRLDLIDHPTAGMVFCLKTAGGRYGFARVTTAAPADYTLTATIWG